MRNIRNDADEEREAQRFFSGDPSDLLGLTYTNGLSVFEVVGRDASNPRTHVVSEHTATGVRFSVSATMVRRYASAPDWEQQPQHACESAA
jgi:hypothetical protein